MRLPQINALLSMSREQLELMATERGVAVRAFETTDALRLKIIDAVVEEELRDLAATNDERGTP